MAIDLNPFDEGGLFGTGDSEKAQKIAEDQRRRMLELAEQSKDIDLGLEYGYGQDVNPYMYGPALGAGEEQFIANPLLAMGLGLAPGSAITDVSSAYDKLGPSAYEGMGPSAYEGLGPSAYEQMGPSAYGKLAFDPNRMGEAQDYFSSVMQDPIDDISEADYARRQRQAEQARRSQMDAALAAAEMKGQGAYGDALQADLMASQAMAGDMYQAGLDANAVAQARRDSAAGSMGDISERIARGEFDADTARALGLDRYASDRAGGMDTYATERAGGMDTYATNRASGLDTYGTNVAAGQDEFAGTKASTLDDWYNQRYEDFYDVQNRNVDRAQEANQLTWDRYNATSDANTALQNQTNQWNRIGAPKQQYDWLSNAYGGAGTATANQGEILMNSPGGNLFDVVMPVASFATKAYQQSVTGGK